MQNCLFCSIAADPTKLMWENQFAAAFNDIHPKAPVHILVVPKVHVERLVDLTDVELAGQLLLAVEAAAKQAGLTDYQVRIHNGRAAGQEIDHLHLHVLGNPIKA